MAEAVPAERAAWAKGLLEEEGGSSSSEDEPLAEPPEPQLPEGTPPLRLAPRRHSPQHSLKGQSEPSKCRGAARRALKGRLVARQSAQRQLDAAEQVEIIRERMAELEQKQAEKSELAELEKQYGAFKRIWSLDRHPPVVEMLEATVSFTAYSVLVGFRAGDTIAVTAKPRQHWWEGYNETERASMAEAGLDEPPRIGWFPSCPGLRIRVAQEAGAGAGAVAPGGRRKARRSSVPNALLVGVGARRPSMSPPGSSPSSPTRAPKRTLELVKAGLDLIETRLAKTEHALRAAERQLSAVEHEAAGVATSMAAVSSVYGGAGASAQAQAEMIRVETQCRQVEKEFAAAEQLRHNLVVSVKEYESERSQAMALLHSVQASVAAAVRPTASVGTEAVEHGAERAKIKAHGGRKVRRFSLS